MASQGRENNVSSPRRRTPKHVPVNTAETLTSGLKDNVISSNDALPLSLKSIISGAEPQSALSQENPWLPGALHKLCAALC